MDFVRHCRVFRGALTIYIRPFSTCFVQQIRVRITMLHESIDFYRVYRYMRFVSLIFRTYIFSVRPPICASLTCRTLIGCLNLSVFFVRKSSQSPICVQLSCIWGTFAIYIFVLFAPCLLSCVIVAYFIYAIIPCKANFCKILDFCRVC